MANKLLLPLLAALAIGCGNNIQLKNNKLEDVNAARSAASFEKTGTLRKGSPSTISAQGRNYTVSDYSSKQATEFVASLPAGSLVPVIYTGGIQGSTIVLETLRRQ
jgi:hypothetical protein